MNRIPFVARFSVPSLPVTRSTGLAVKLVLNAHFALVVHVDRTVKIYFNFITKFTTVHIIKVLPTLAAKTFHDFFGIADLGESRVSESI